MSESFTIILPLPNRILSPNCPPGSIGGRIKKASAAKRLRNEARIAANAEGIETGPWPLVSVLATFYHKTERRRDDVNSLAMLKAAYDGIVDSGAIVDDDSRHLKTLTPIFKIDKAFPRVEILVERIEPGG